MIRRTFLAILLAILPAKWALGLGLKNNGLNPEILKIVQEEIARQSVLVRNILKKELRHHDEIDAQVPRLVDRRKYQAYLPPREWFGNEDVVKLLAYEHWFNISRWECEDWDASEDDENSFITPKVFRKDIKDFDGDDEMYLKYRPVQSIFVDSDVVDNWLYWSIPGNAL